MEDDLFLWLLLISLLTGSAIGSYSLGKKQERKDYTAAFVKSTELTYWEGFDDGEKSGKIKGYNKCLNEDYNTQGRY